MSQPGFALAILDLRGLLGGSGSSRKGGVDPGSSLQQLLGLGQAIPITFLLFLARDSWGGISWERGLKGQFQLIALKIVMAGTFINGLPTHTISNQWVRTLGSVTLE